LKQEIETGGLPFRPESCQIFRKKKYYSRDREEFIVFDIAIEISLRNHERPFEVVLVECKNYEGTVPVDDIEEFGSKIRQVAGFNVKGIFATASSFQSGTLNIAKNQGFAIVRYFQREGFRWELARALLIGARNPSSRTRGEIEYALTSPAFRPTSHNVYAATPQGYSTGWGGVWQGLDLTGALDDAVLQKIRQPRPPTRQRVCFIPKEKIERRAEAALKLMAYVRSAVDLERLVTIESQTTGLSVTYLEESESALGSITFNPPEIKIFTNNQLSHLARFTLAHELGHHYLGHDRYLTRENVASEDLDGSQFITVPRNDIERLEWQANTFASCLLMPRREFLNAFTLYIGYLGIRNRGHGALFLDGQPENVANFHLVCKALSHYFNVSKIATRLRMSALGLLIEAQGAPPPRRKI
jgi:Zn-dependent peptidase ImmA (M78 family)